MSARVLFLSAAVLLGCALWLFTVDVYAEGGSHFCGSAYDVVLLKGDGFMGGEVPANQRALDRQCVRKSGRMVALGSAIGAAGIGLGGFGALRTRSRGTSLVSFHRPHERA